MKITVPSKCMLIAITFVCTMSFGCSKTSANNSAKAQTVLENAKNKIAEATPAPRVRDTSPNPVSDFEYDLYGDSGIILKKYKGTRQDVVVPSEIEGLPVLALGVNFAYKANIITVVLPETIRVIEKYAFQYNNQLEEINLPDSLEEIGEEAFQNDTRLEIKKFPASLKSVGSNAFDEIGIKKLLFTKNLEKVFNNATFCGCKNLTEVEIEEGVTRIPENFFAGCYGLQHIKFPSSIKAVGENAFARSGLIDIDFPPDVKRIRGLRRATEYCYHLSVKNQLDVRKLDPYEETQVGGTYAEYYKYLFQRFAKASGESIMSSGGIEKDFFDKYNNGTVEYEYSYILNLEGDGINILGYLGNKTELIVPETLEGLPVVFVKLEANCDFTSVSLPDTVKDIGGQCFYKQKKLQKITLPKGLEKIWGYAFCNSGLTEVTIPKSVKILGEGAFWKCSNLSKITFEENSQLETIESECFEECTKLADIKLPDSLKYIEEKAFYGCLGNEILTFPASIIEIHSSAFGKWKNLKDLVIPENIEYIYKRSTEPKNYNFMDAFDYGFGDRLPLKTKARLVKMKARN